MTLTVAAPTRVAPAAEPVERWHPALPCPPWCTHADDDCQDYDPVVGFHRGDFQTMTTEDGDAVALSLVRIDDKPTGELEMAIRVGVGSRRDVLGMSAADARALADALYEYARRADAEVPPC
jgi:hypothetical protein